MNCVSTLQPNTDADASDRIYTCMECDWKGALDAMKPIKDIAERVSLGELMAAGECPDCGVLISCPDEDIEEHTLVACVKEAVRRDFAVFNAAASVSRADCAKEIAMFGTTLEAVDKAFGTERFPAEGFGAAMKCISHLSDVQERLLAVTAAARGQDAALEEVRQALNPEKYGIATNCVARSSQG